MQQSNRGIIIAIIFLRVHDFVITTYFVMFTGSLGVHTYINCENKANFQMTASSSDPDNLQKYMKYYVTVLLGAPWISMRGTELHEKVEGNKCLYLIKQSNIQCTNS